LFSSHSNIQQSKMNAVLLLLLLPLVSAGRRNGGQQQAGQVGKARPWQALRRLLVSLFGSGNLAPTTLVI